MALDLRRTNTRLALAAAVTLALAGSALTVAGHPPAPSGGEDQASAEECPAGFERLADREAREDADAEREGSEGDGCVSRKQPEPYGELSLADGERAGRSRAPFAELAPGAYAAAVAQRDALAARAPTPGTDGSWTPVARTPLLGAEPGYDEVNGQGFVELAGRIQDFALVPGTSTLYAAVANGGVWRSDDLGGSWRSAGDSLPTQVVGSVAWSPAGGGTLVAVTGDGAFGGSSLGGLGAFRSTDDGRSWTKAAGVPDGALGFKAAVDPTDPEVIYAATGAGLYRSTDAGISFVDVVLPTGPCAGRTTATGCFLANMVTDVVVQAPDDFGHRGGAVLAAVGWRAGPKSNPDGTVQAPANGLYSSADGRPGSFVRTGGSGFAPQNRIGRIELGPTTGADQNHGYVYALVQDAVRLNGGAPVIDIPDELGGLLGPLPNITVLQGVYVSADFGATWALMAPAELLQAPTTGSALIGTAQVVSRYGPGIQSWYNQFILPDPTRQVGGVPTRLTFGLEEVWQNELSGLPQAGLSVFKVIGRYFGGTTCLFLNLGLPACPTNRQLQQSTTTHPDQHGAVYVPDGRGGVTLVVGNDGGAYTQSVGPGQELDNTRWGIGANRGFNTLLPYDAVMSGDGTVWSGLQDNGQMKIEPDGRAIQTFGGDGFFAAVDPGDSDVAYEESPGGALRVTTDGGRKWRDIDPQLENAGFATPFAMDPIDSRHLVSAARNIRETVAGPDTARPDGLGLAVTDDWVTVFDLGTRTNPGQAPAPGFPSLGAVGDDPPNRTSAVDVEGDNVYVGYCGYCDTVTQGVPFGNGIATNVGGREPPRRGTGDGWHVAAAAGLPRRIVTSVAVDPTDPRTVYVTLGGYARKWAPPGALGDDVEAVGSGHVFRSDDAAQSFRDISGDLPDGPANWVELRGGQLLVGTDVGVFVSETAGGGPWSVLGRGLPAAPVSTVRLAPNDPDLVVVASFGRGVYTYRFPPGSAPAPAGAAPAPAPRPSVTPPTGGSPATARGALAAALVGAGMLALRRRVRPEPCRRRSGGPASGSS